MPLLSLSTSCYSSSPKKVPISCCVIPRVHLGNVKLVNEREGNGPFGSNTQVKRELITEGNMSCDIQDLPIYLSPSFFFFFLVCYYFRINKQTNKKELHIYG